MNLTKLVVALAFAVACAEEAPRNEPTRANIKPQRSREEVVIGADGEAQRSPATAASNSLVSIVPDDEDHKTLDSSGISVRCRYCGAHLAWKHHYQNLPSESKARAKYTRAEASLGTNGEVVYFDNPSGVEFELASFVDSEAIPTDSFTQQDTFFDAYNWRSLTCPRCAKHVGWKFTHVLQEQCMMETENHMNGAGKAKKGTRAKLSEIVDSSFSYQKCHVMSNGWWSYQHCYKNEIRQYHEEADGTKPSDWSLGHYSEDRSNDKEIIHHFSGGQHCDENGKLRSTTVKYVCCPEQHDVTVDTIDEPSLCSYVLRVCVPDLCQSKPKNPDAAVTKKLEKACAKTLAADHDNAILPVFYSLVWPTTIAEDSPELKWAQSLSVVTSISGR
ncbi:Protein OS-9 [Aphanomyces cochlioides]|nr:Protein OS-9 [Aphanomyces cochlioides]